MTGWRKLPQDAWLHPRLFRCPLCAALLLSEEDEAVHAQWHELVASPTPSMRHGDWDEADRLEELR